MKTSPNGSMCEGVSVPPEELKSPPTRGEEKTDWVWVPREPTEAMIEAMHSAWFAIDARGWHDTYRAMISASPTKGDGIGVSSEAESGRGTTASPSTALRSDGGGE